MIDAMVVFANHDTYMYLIDCAFLFFLAKTRYESAGGAGGCSCDGLTQHQTHYLVAADYNGLSQQPSVFLL